MPTSFTESRHSSEFILSEANGNRSRESATVVSGQNLAAGTVVELDSNGKLTIFEGTTDSGSAPDPEAIGIILPKADATDGDITNVAYLARDAEVNVNLLTFNGGQAEMVASLATRGIVVRT